MNRKQLLAILMRHGPLLLLLAAVTVFFWKVFTFAGVLFHFDLLPYNVPIRDYFFKNVARGRFPLWSETICGGFPLFDEGQFGPLYWPNYLLFTWLPSWFALSVSMIFHSILGALGGYLYLQRGHSKGAAAVGALTYSLSAPLVYHLVHYMFYESLCLFPWLLFFFDRFLSKGRIADVLGGALMLGMMFTTGHQQAPILAAMCFGAFALVLSLEALAARRPRAAIEITLASLLIALVTLAVATVIIHGMTRLLPESIRRASMESSFLYSYSLVPDALSRLASPALHGHARDGTWYLKGAPEKELAVYLGLAVFCLAPLAFAGRSGRRDRAHLAVVVFGLLLMLGPAGPFAGLLEHVPLLNRMRIPTRFIMPMALSLAYLVTSAVDQLRCGLISARRAISFCSIGLMAWAFAAWGGALASFGRDLFAATGNALPATPASGLRQDLLLRSVLAVALFVAVLATLWARDKTPALRAGALAAIGALIFIDLAIAGIKENPVTDPSVYQPRATIDFLRSELAGFRIYVPEPWGDAKADGWNIDASSLHEAGATLPFALPAVYGIHAASCSSPLILARSSRINRALSADWLRQMCVKYELTTHPNTLNLRRARLIGRVKIFDVPGAAPRYSLAARVETADSEDEAFRKVTALGADMTTAVVEGGSLPSLSESARGALQIIEEKPDLRRLRVALDRPTFLVVRENYYPGWRAAVDRIPARIQRVNYLFYGFAVPAGNYEVALSYRPHGFAAAMAISLAAFFGVLALALFYRPIRRKRPALLDVPADGRAGRRILLAILSLMAILTLVAIVRHPSLWDFSHVQYPRW